MEHEEDLGKLEENVEKLLNSLDSVQDDRVKLKADIEVLELEKKTLEEEVSQLKEEKGLILKRVTALIGSIEKWEREATETPVSDNVDKVNAEDDTHIDPVQGMLVGN